MAPKKKPRNQSDDRKENRKKKSRPDSRSRSRTKATPTQCPAVPQKLPIHKKPIVLDTPIKSPNDFKDYKAIQLNNGLKVLLISDILCSTHQSSKTIRENRSYIDSEIAKFNRDVLRIPPRDDLVGDIEAPEDLPSSKHVDDCNCTDLKAAVALCVATGSLAETPDALGLAHLLEHMLFDGSKKYPKGAEFDLFLAENGGESNGHTTGDFTLFPFHVDLCNLPKALDMFSSFFIEPMLDLNFLVKERDIVDDEFNSKKCVDDEKRIHILMLTGKKGHPVCQFSWGSKETLRTDGNNAKKLRNLLLEFHKQYYSSDNMYLVMQASEDLNKLEKLAIKYFGQIPRSTAAKPERNFDLMPFDTPEFRKWYHMVPTNAFNLLYLTWEFPPKAVDDYQSKPLDYIQRVLSNQSKGGIAHYLIKKNLISAISCSFGKNQHLRSPYSTLFTVSFHVIDIAQEKLDNIIEAFFSYIKFRIHIKPQEWFFNEFKEIRAMELHYMTDRLVQVNPLWMALYMLKHGPRNCLIGDALMTEWKPDLIQEYALMLVPEKANYMLLSQDEEIQKGCTLTEPYFGTEYSVRDIPPSTMQRWKNAKLRSDFCLFKPNLFLTTDFSVIKEGSCFVPEKVDVKDSDLIEMWYELDTTNAYAEFRFLFMTETDLTDVKKSSSMSLWAGILERLVRPRLYGAIEAKLSYSVSRDHFGIRAEAQGFSQNLDLIINEILSVAKNLYFSVKSQNKPALFESEKAVLSQRLRSEFTNNEVLEKQLCSRIMLNTVFTSVEMHNALQDVTYSEFRKFCKKFLTKMFSLGFAMGNLDKETAQEVAREITDVFEYEPLPEDERPQILSTELPLGESILRVRSMDRNCNCSIVSVIYQIGSVDVKSYLTAHIIMDAMREPAFQELRVERNLGYKVEVGVDLNIASSVAVYLKVICQSKEFPGSYVVRQIDQFVAAFYKTRIQPMTEEDFLKLKRDYNYLLPESGSEFMEIIKQEYVFNRRAVESRAMSRIQLDEFKTWYRQYLLPSCAESKMRKLVIQVVGSGDHEYPVKIVQDWEIKSCPNEAKLVLLLPKTASSDHISDIVQFNKSLRVLPKHKLR